MDGVRDGFIHLPKRRVTYTDSDRPIVRLTREAYDVLVDITNETCLPMSRVVSEIIIQSQSLIRLDEGKETEE